MAGRQRFMMGLGPLTSLVLTLGSSPAMAQQHGLTFEDFLALPSVSDPQLSPDGRWVAYVVTTSSLADNRGTSRIWLADVTTGQTRPLTQGPSSDREPRWSPDGGTLAFVSTREGGAQLWALTVAGGEAHKITSVPDGVASPVWRPDGKGLIVTADVKWPAEQEIDRRNGGYPTDARLWTELFYRHWDEWRAGKRQHLLAVRASDGRATDLTPLDRDVPTIASSGDGDVSVSPDGREIAVAVHADPVADNTHVDIDVMGSEGEDLHPVTPGPGVANTPRFSPDGQWLAYLSLARPGFEADRSHLMLLHRVDGRTGGPPVDGTPEWTLSVASYAWCPDSKCVYAVVDERGYENLYRIALPSFRRSLAVGPDGVNTDPGVAPDGLRAAYLHQTATHPAEVWFAGRALTHHTDPGLGTLDLHPLEAFGFIGALGDSVFGWVLKPPGFDPARKYPLVYLLHGGPQGAWHDEWHARWNYQMFASRGYVVAAVNFHGSTGYGQRFTDAISRHWGDYPLEDVMRGLDVIARLPWVDSTRVGAAGASYGGYLVYWLAGHTSRFKVLVAHDGVFNPASMYGATEELWFPEWEFGGTVYANRGLYEQWSPLNFARAWKTPMLIVHSQLDYRVDLSEGFQAFTALRKMGVPAKFLYFPDEGHFVVHPRNRRLWWGTVFDWLDTYLAPAGSRAP